MVRGVATYHDAVVRGQRLFDGPGIAPLPHLGQHKVGVGGVGLQEWDLPQAREQPLPFRD
jgi:hypothetical protein